MASRSGERYVVIALVLALASGLLFDALAAHVPRPPDRVPPGPRFAVRTDYCPPPIRTGKATTKTTLASAAESDVSVEIEPLEQGEIPLPPGQALVAPPADSAVNVVVYGGRVAATTDMLFELPVKGLGASACSHVAARQWHFAEGSSALGSDERLLLYNPFPEDAVVNVTLFTPRGELLKANLGRVAVPAHDYLAVRLNDFVKPQPLLAVSVEAIRGRIVAWRALLADDEERGSGIELTLGTPRASDIWYFPAGELARGVEEWISLVNPSHEEATVTISLSTDKEPFQPPRLVEIAIPPRSVKRVSFERSVQGKQAGAGAVSATVRAVNGVEIVAERTLWYDRSQVKGVASEIGATELDTEWLLGPAAMAPVQDSLALMNPGRQEAIVDISLLHEEGLPGAPEPLQDLRIAQGSRVDVRLQRWTRGETVVALVRSTTPVVAERFSYSDAADDVATLLGVRL